MNRTSFDNRPFCSEELLFRDLCWCWTNGTTIRRELYVIAWALTKPSSQPEQLPSPSFSFSFPSARHMCPFLSSSRSGGQNSLGEFTINAMILSLLFWRSWKKKNMNSYHGDISFDGVNSDLSLHEEFRHWTRIYILRISMNFSVM